LRGRAPLSVTCPDCGRVLSKARKGWECAGLECSVIRIRCSSPWTEPRRIERAARPRTRPLSGEELRSLLEPYLTPGVERLLENS